MPCPVIDCCLRQLLPYSQAMLSHHWLTLCLLRPPPLPLPLPLCLMHRVQVLLLAPDKVPTLTSCPQLRAAINRTQNAAYVQAVMERFSECEAEVAAAECVRVSMPGTEPGAWPSFAAYLSGAGHECEHPSEESWTCERKMAE